MKTKILILFLLNFLVFLTKKEKNQKFQTHKKPQKIKKKKIRLAFGSCFNNEKYSNRYDIFTNIADLNPDYWLWLGDIIYGDIKYLPFIYKYFSNEKIANLYKKLKFNKRKYNINKDYQKLLKTVKGSVFGIWDDHDYGKNDETSSNPNKDKSKKLFLDFLDDFTYRRKKGRGLYDSYYLDSGYNVKLILLDAHYDKKGEDDLGKKF